MATIRYQNGQIAPLSTPVAPMTGQYNAQNTTAIGDALQGLGEQGSRLAIAYNQANDARHLIEAEQEMQSTVLDFAKWQAENPEESNWIPEWEKRTQGLQKSFDKRKISDSARLGLTRSFGRWSTGETLQLQGQAVKQAGQRARTAASNTIQMALETGDEERANSAVDLLVASNNAFPEEAQSMRLAIADKVKAKRQTDALNYANAALDQRDIEGAKAIIQSAPFDDSERKMRLAQIDATHAVNEQKDEFQALALTKPQEALKSLDDPQKFALVSPGDREVMRTQTKSIIAGQSLDAFRDIKSRIDLGQVKPGETFESFKELDPLMRDQLLAYNRDFANKSSMNTPAEYEAAIAAIDNLQDDGSGLPRAQLESGIESRFNGPYAEQLKKRLDDKFADPAKSEVLKEALGQLNRWAFDEKRFGEYQRPVLGPDGNPVVTEKSVKTLETGKSSGLLWWRKLPWMGGPVETQKVVEQDTKQIEKVLEDDPVKRDAIAARLGMIRAALEKEAAAGKITTPDEAMQRAAELSGQPRVKSAASAIDSKVTNPLLKETESKVPSKEELDAEIDKFKRK